MADLDIQSIAACTFLSGSGNTYLSDYPLFRILKKHNRMERIPYIVDGIKNTLTGRNIPVKATGSDGVGMVTHDAGFNYSIAYHKHYPLKRIIRPEHMNTEKSSYAHVNALQELLDSTMQELLNSLHADLLTNTTDTDRLDSLLLAASTTPSVSPYQGVDPAKYSFWQNQVYDAKNTKIPGTVFDGSGMTEDNIVEILNYVISRSSVGKNSTAVYAICGDTAFSYLSDRLSSKLSLNAQGGKPVDIDLRNPVLNGVEIINANGLTRSGYMSFPSKYILLLSPDNMKFFYDQPYASGEGLNSLIKVSNNIHNPRVKITEAEDVASLVYLDVDVGSGKAIFHKTPDNLYQWAHLIFRGNLMIRDRSQLTLIYEA